VNDFSCQITDRDYLAAFAPEQPEEIKVGQEWMHAPDGATFPITRVVDGQVDLGHDSYMLVISLRQLRDEWVCIDLPSPEPVGDLDVQRVKRG
jgi:hypothetical protein